MLLLFVPTAPAPRCLCSQPSAAQHPIARRVHLAPSLVVLVRSIHLLTPVLSCNVVTKAAAGMKCAVASIPGAAAGAGAPPASTKTKAQIKNEKRKAKKAAGEGDDDDEDGAGDGSSAVPSADAQANEMVQKMASASLEPTAAAPAVAEDPAKKLKNLKKKLKQIDQLVESGAALSEDQQAKVSRRAELVAEIEALE